MAATPLTKFSEITTAVLNEVANGSTTDSDRVKEFIIRAYRKCISKILELNEDYYLTTTEITSVVDQQTYDWEDDLSITDLMKFIALHDSDGDPLRRGSIRSDIEEYFLMGNRGFGFTTPPSSAETYDLWYIQRPADLSADDSVPALEKIHFEILFYDAIVQYYMWKKNVQMAQLYKVQRDEMWESFIDFHSTDLSDTKRVQVVDDGLS